ncbi:NAD(P)H-dependent D-xylose reductase (XR) [Geranomyces michiganensis]|nr:NAD(P)H-dependent D-xylose reductase (XR) [Geranomyces michiganensis]
MFSAQPAAQAVGRSSDLLQEILAHVGNTAGLLTCEAVCREWRSLLASPSAQARVWKPLFNRFHACLLLDEEAAKPTRLTWREAVLLAEAWTRPWPAASDMTSVDKPWSFTSDRPTELTAAVGVIKPFPSCPVEVRLAGDALISYLRPFVRECLLVGGTTFLGLMDTAGQHYLTPTSDLDCRIPLPAGTKMSWIEGNICVTKAEEDGEAFAWKIEQAAASSYILKPLLTVPAASARVLCFNNIILGYLDDDGVQPDPHFRLIRLSDGHEFASSTHRALANPPENAEYGRSRHIHVTHTHLFAYSESVGHVFVFALRDLALRHVIELPEMEFALGDVDYEEAIELGLQPTDEQAYPACLESPPSDGSALYFALPMPDPTILVLDPFACELVRYGALSGTGMSVSGNKNGVFVVRNTAGRGTEMNYAKVAVLVVYPMLPAGMNQEQVAPGGPSWLLQELMLGLKHAPPHRLGGHVGAELSIAADVLTGWVRAHEIPQVLHRGRRCSSSFYHSWLGNGGKVLDLYLIHWPVSFQPGGELVPKDKDGKTIQDSTDILDTWKELEKLVDAGKVRSIGVSNATVEILEKVIKHARIKPAVNQVELHPYLSQTALLDFANKHNVLLTAYSPLGSGHERSPLKDAVIQEISKKHGNKDPAQIILSWAVQRGTVVIPKSVTESRIKSNRNIEKLSDEMAQINGIKTRVRVVDPKEFWRIDIFKGSYADL